MSIIRFENTQCKDCYKCIGHCPVKSIEMRAHQAQIIERDCILCGTCTVVCPQKAKHDESDVLKIKARMKEGACVIAAVAPSYIAYFAANDFVEMRAALCVLGFSQARETAEGAYQVKSEYERLLRAGTQRTMVSSCCASVNAYVQKHLPEAIPYLAPVKTPLQAQAEMIRRDTPDAVIVFIGPCIAKKGECAARNSLVDYAITFGDLLTWLDDEQVSFPEMESSDAARLSRLFPIEGGILRTMQKEPSYTYLSVSGAQACMETLRDVVARKLEDCFIEMNFCEGGCVGGPSFRRKQIGSARATRLVKRDAQKGGEGDFAPVAINMARAFQNEQMRIVEPTEKQISAIFQKMGKEGKEDELNCGMCGYASCREKAIAVFLGRAEISMCLPMMKKRAESFSDKVLSVTPNAVIAVDMDLKIHEINHAALEIFGLEHADIIGQPVSRILDEFDFVDMLANRKMTLKKRVYLAEYSAYLDQSFFFDPQSGIIVLIMANITSERQKRARLMSVRMRAANMADDIVEKQLGIVHEIASLLGESAADTKAAIADLKNAILLDIEEDQHE
ncbi:MAG: [Fe-Fe] hydrogenase large subunit C-terminal domain-containing protein [Clostridia bacterium]